MDDRWRPFVAVLPFLASGCTGTTVGAVPLSGEQVGVSSVVAASSAFSEVWVEPRFEVVVDIPQYSDVWVVPRRVVTASTVPVVTSTVPVVTSTTAVPVVVSTTSWLVETPQELVLRIFPEEDHQWALRVMACESSNDPLAVNSWSKTMGLFQHHPRHWEERSVMAGLPGADPFDAEANVVVAEWLLNVGGQGHAKGKQHWECK